MMLSRSDNSELINFGGVFIVSLVIGGTILFRPYFDVENLQFYGSIFLFMLFLFISGGLYFKRKSKLSFIFLFWQCLLSIAYLAYLTSIIIYLWSVFSGGELGLSIIIFLISGMCLCGLLVRVLEPKSNYRMGIQNGRFIVSSFSFNSAIWQRDVSDDNPVLLFFGFKKKKGDTFQSTLRRGGTCSAVAASLAVIMQASGSGALFETIILILGTVAFGYAFSFNYIADFLFCIRAGLSKPKIKSK
ncbi:hypothetical protein [Pseudoalteromonas sp.]|uniref:hypothetical protein n=1 Tax=Pseudoalteromonas sp. TaxID=53249 RepID=UPI0023548C95|nr:hypothetical protein [Pseudoalteromonas sp.]